MSSFFSLFFSGLSDYIPEFANCKVQIESCIDKERKLKLQLRDTTLDQPLEMVNAIAFQIISFCHGSNCINVVHHSCFLYLGDCNMYISLEPYLQPATIRKEFTTSFGKVLLYTNLSFPDRWSYAVPNGNPQKMTPFQPLDLTTVDGWNPGKNQLIRSDIVHPCSSKNIPGG